MARTRGGFRMSSEKTDISSIKLMGASYLLKPYLRVRTYTNSLITKNEHCACAQWITGVRNVPRKTHFPQKNNAIRQVR